MIDERPSQHLEYAEFWGYSPEEKFSLFEKVLDDAMQGKLRKECGSAIVRLRNRFYWEQCEASGVDIVDLAHDLAMDENHLRRVIKPGNASPAIMWWAIRSANLDDERLEQLPDDYCDVVGLVQASEYLLHHCNAVVNCISSPMRLPVPKLSLPHAALLFVILGDSETLEKWIFLTAPVRNDFSQAHDSKKLVDFISSIYQHAIRSIAPSAAASILGEWAPENSDIAGSLGHIADAWNPYQLYWHFSWDAIMV
jgi:hypothetical protein